MKQLTFEQLPPRLRETVLQRASESAHVDLDHVIEHWTGKLEELGYLDPEIRYCGFWSQGDGASFSCKEVPDPITDENVRAAWEAYAGACVLLGEPPAGDVGNLAWGHISSNSSRYVHANTMRLDWSYDDFPAGYMHNDPESIAPFIARLMEAVDAYFTGLEESARSLANDIYSDLQKDYEWQTSEECLSKLLAGELFDVDDDETELL